MRVVAAMSGGVDSAVAAARLVADGHEVVGVHLALSRQRAATRSGSRGCCTIEDSRDAWRAADRLGIPFYVWDFSEEFAEAVVADFLAEYAAGRTPNPCLRCNERIKFAALLDRALAMGYDALATGHYANLVPGDSESDGPQLHRAADIAKDQSYVLGVLTSDQLRRSLFPLGNSTKSEVRTQAAELGLAVAAKPDSHDICFIPDGDTAGYLRERMPVAPGEIVDARSGEVLGTHDGAFQFTVGQRRGLHLGRPTTDGARRYVVAVDIVSRTVAVGPQELLATDRLTCDEMTWAAPATCEPFEATVQVRAHGQALPARVLPVRPGPDAQPQGFMVELSESFTGVAPGQTAVAYIGTRVICSGIITSADRGTRPAP